MAADAAAALVGANALALASSAQNSSPRNAREPGPSDVAISINILTMDLATSLPKLCAASSNNSKMQATSFSGSIANVRASFEATNTSNRSRKIPSAASAFRPRMQRMCTASRAESCAGRRAALIALSTSMATLFTSPIASIEVHRVCIANCVIQPLSESQSSSRIRNSQIRSLSLHG